MQILIWNFFSGSVTVKDETRVRGWWEGATFKDLKDSYWDLGELSRELQERRGKLRPERPCSMVQHC